MSDVEKNKKKPVSAKEKTASPAEKTNLAKQSAFSKDNGSSAVSVQMVKAIKVGVEEPNQTVGRVYTFEDAEKEKTQKATTKRASLVEVTGSSTSGTNKSNTKARKSAPNPPPPPAKKGKKLGQSSTAKIAWFELFFDEAYLRTVPSLPDKCLEKQCDFIQSLLKLEKGASILDVGCGLGQHAARLAELGYKVTGLDLSKAMIKNATIEAEDKGVSVDFIHKDMREMDYKHTFDAVICWGTTFGYFDEDGNRALIQTFRKALKPMGVLLLDIANRDHIVGNQPGSIWFQGKGCVCMEETYVNSLNSRLVVKRTVLLDEGRQYESQYSLRLYSLHEIGQLLSQGGFRVSHVSGSEATKGVFFGADSPRIITLAEKKVQPKK